MALIPLSRGLFAIVDDDMVDFLNQWKFYPGKKGHPRATIYRKGIKFHIPIQFCVMYRYLGSKEAIELYRLEVRAMNPMPLIDHKNRNPLDNRLENLRHATNQQNVMNIGKRKGLSSKYLGVSIGKGSGQKKWEAKVKFNRKLIFFKQFPFTAEGEIEAAKARDAVALKYHGEFASLNFPEIKPSHT